MKKLSLILVFILACVAVFCQVDTTGAGEIAKATGLPLQWVIYGVIAIYFIIGHWAIPKRAASILTWIEKILIGTLTVIKWINDKTNNAGGIAPKDVVVTPPKPTPK